MRFRIVAAALVAAVVAVLPIAAQEQRPRLDIHWVPTPPAVVDAMLKLADVKPTDVVYDLGCGDGVIVATAAQKYGARAVGIDLDPQRVQEAKERVQKMGVSDKVKILQGDLFEADISEATVVTLYLLQSINIRLMPKLQKELKPGTRIVSQSFDMGEHWAPEKRIDVDGRPVYLWTIK
ncbi:MAG TPA: methyltransferase domain-containing protein [Vicinamibacterales bacterium]|nr:methyltransferase domain-containing protein [Vicinamibacterales bacterium]